MTEDEIRKRAKELLMYVGGHADMCCGECGCKKQVESALTKVWNEAVTKVNEMISHNVFEKSMKENYSLTEMLDDIDALKIKEKK